MNRDAFLNSPPIPITYTQTSINLYTSMIWITSKRTSQKIALMVNSIEILCLKKNLLDPSGKRIIARIEIDRRSRSSVISVMVKIPFLNLEKVGTLIGGKISVFDRNRVESNRIESMRKRRRGLSVKSGPIYHYHYPPRDRIESVAISRWRFRGGEKRKASSHLWFARKTRRPVTNVDAERIRSPRKVRTDPWSDGALRHGPGVRVCSSNRDTCLLAAGNHFLRE